ncbi:MAG: hypothetical protein ABEJ71_01395 [Halodesulfurarchaeum sp.]
MAVNVAFLTLSVFGAVLLLVVLFIVTRVRPWHYPVRYTDFDYGVREKAKKLASRGPSGDPDEDIEAEGTEQPEGLWERLKRGLYTYPKRPSKVR